MEKPIENYWSLRLAELKGVLQTNNFEVYIAENTESAKNTVLEIVSQIAPE